MSALNELLAKIGSQSIEIIDLTTPLSSETPLIALPEPFANAVPTRLEPISNFDDAGPLWSWNNLHVSEHSGTHLSAPTHWVTGRDGLSVDQILPNRLIGPAAVIDITAEVEQNADFVLEPEHLECWEAENGPLPEGAWLIVRTGWSSRSGDPERFANIDSDGAHTPGISPAAAKWLAESRPISGYGVETVGIDASRAGSFTPRSPAHHYLLGNNKYGLTLLRNVDQLPALGAVLIVSPLPIVGGTGSPARVFALVERS